MNFTDKTKLTRSDIAKMVKPLQWVKEYPIVYADVFYLKLLYYKKNDIFLVHAGIYYDKDSVLSFVSTAENEDEAKQIAENFVINTVCDALQIEE